ncbi:MAG: metal-dependent transcriptional regulator [Candidatus Micrarchaeota archaeon]
MHEKTIQDYCRAIEKMDSGDGARSVDIAKALALSKNTVALTLRKLSEGGFVEMERYGRVRLAGKGAAVARKMNFKHRVIEAFLVDKLGMDRKKVHAEACAMEHWASDDMIERLYRFIGRPKTDPHGRRIA